MLEAEFYRNQVRKNFEKWGDHERIENASGSGTPDISYAFYGRTGWCETKIIRQGKLHFEQFQIAWIKRRARHTYGKDVWVLASDGKTVYLFSAYSIINAPRVRHRDWLVVSVSDLEPIVVGPKPWAEILCAMTYTGEFSSLHDEPHMLSSTTERRD